LLVQRGITKGAEARKFFRPQLPDLHDPFLMRDMDIAVERLNAAMGRKERIMIYGDYDVDGTTAVATVYKFIQQFYSNIDYYIPDRYNEGYGVSFKGVDYAVETGVKLIIVLDCGIKAVEEIAYAKEKGVDFIICDHHVPDEVLPPAVAILNAKREDNTYPYTDLSGCGVGFKFMQAFALSNGIEFHHLIPLLDLVAVSIASDIVPIMGENRILAYHGLKQLNSNPSIGMKAIIDVCGLSDREISMSDIVFKIGPRINASGRIQNGKEAVDLLIEKDFSAAIEKANQINQYNETRKDLDKSRTEEANRIVEHLEGLKERRSIVLFNEEWHKGVIGIVASRLTEIYYRPAVVLTRTDDMATGSARSVSGFDVYKAIEYCRDLLENFGGHTYAAGLSMKVENVPAFEKRFEEYVAQHILPEQTCSVIDIDAEIDFRDITPKFFADLKRFNPFGPDNTKPVFCTHHVYDYGTSKVVGRDQEHIKLELVDNKSNNVMNGIAFGQSSHVRYIKTKRSFDICYTIEENTHKRGEVQLQIEDIKPIE
jgi:single-stranded-DNA-specific exonuclease